MSIIDAARTDAARRLLEQRGTLGELAEKLGIALVSLSADEAVATMPAEGNRQPYGVVNGGAYVTLGETLGSFAANVHAIDRDKVAVGIEINATHTRSVRTGTVTGTCRALHLGGTLTTHEITITDEQDRLVSTVRITNFLRNA
ncbi:PaaI family thioesterase [Pseudoclavibacter sp. 13-3]|uniref:PaaI family thioesterase n=1 Tax=Pseudoclavibacter sp. 13-3 TaxID=2901228 RepID=UPI001E4B7A46|nr:hotdog fold thioesterase [Pseudoclavibacter sp. 13-3]MCD7101949.1 hotdog fold thioesterase [Pseudoclavibacter sp. 13-3]